MPLGDAASPDILEITEPDTKRIRIGLISDTHIPADAKILPPHVREAFKGTDLILHAGDIYLPSILDELETMAPVLAARGNDDGDFPQDRRFKISHVLNINGLSLGLIHRIFFPGTPRDPFDKRTEKDFGQQVDIIVFGDSHVAVVARHNGILLVNPGSPTVPNGLRELGTVALLEIVGKKAEARIVQLSELPIVFHRELIYH